MSQSDISRDPSPEANRIERLICRGHVLGLTREAPARTEPRPPTFPRCIPQICPQSSSQRLAVMTVVSVRL
jgi:hypothetical protein